MLVSNKGFTLLEILIAITLLAFISLAVVNITENAAQTKERTTIINENNLQIETALSRFEWDFSQIYSPLYFTTPYVAQNQDLDGDGRNDKTGEPVQLNQELDTYNEFHQNLRMRFENNQHFSGISKEGLPIPRFHSPDKTTFEFFTASNRRKIVNVKQSHFNWVKYTLGPPLEKKEDQEKNPNIPQSLKTLVRYALPDDAYSPNLLSQDDPRVISAVLLENVEDLEFQYWDYKRKKWETSLRTIEGGLNEIRGVKIKITWYDSFGEKRIDQRIFRNLWPMVVPIDQPLPTNPNSPNPPNPPNQAGTNSTNTQVEDD
jgi:prepilin-type N-terminal cleavage/methylation domain-containing protein